MKTNFSLLSYMKNPKNYQTDPGLIYMRITVNGKRAEIATGRECEPLSWNPAQDALKAQRKKPDLSMPISTTGKARFMKPIEC